MPLMTWNDRPSVCVQAIDGQNVALVDTLNELHAALRRGSTRELTGPLLQNLLAYTRQHFATEEALLTMAGDEGLGAHRAEHRELTRKIEIYIQRFERGEIALSPHLMNFLRDWLTNHIRRVDHASVQSSLEQGDRRAETLKF